MGFTKKRMMSKAAPSWRRGFRFYHGLYKKEDEQRGAFLEAMV